MDKSQTAAEVLTFDFWSFADVVFLMESLIQRSCAIAVTLMLDTGAQEERYRINKRN